MMIRKDYVLIDGFRKSAEGSTAGAHAVEQRADKQPGSMPSQSELEKRSIFSNQVSDAKADLMMGKSVDVCL